MTQLSPCWLTLPVLVASGEGLSPLPALPLTIFLAPGECLGFLQPTALGPLSSDVPARDADYAGPSLEALVHLRGTGSNVT